MGKLYTIPEANEMLAHVAPALVELQTKYPQAVDIQEKIERGALANGGAQYRDKWNRILARVDELLARFDEWEIVVRSIEDGLVDFPATIDGGPAFLCWKLGEPAVRFWHRPNEGFAGRKSL
ncbi:MAG: DUF2203 domain-containing protein [Actinomycetota bacterium]